eukprot:1196275-Prorocentrum_minimum.AAC.1
MDSNPSSVNCEHIDNSRLCSPVRGASASIPTSLTPLHPFKRRFVKAVRGARHRIPSSVTSFAACRVSAVSPVRGLRNDNAWSVMCIFQFIASSRRFADNSSEER